MMRSCSARKAALQVRVLGSFAVLRHQTRLPLPRSKKTRALLAYLAITARTHSRDRLCAMFWPVPDDPRAALRWSLSRLRPLVDERDCRRIIADRESVSIDLTHVNVDLLSLRSVARNGLDAIATDALRKAEEALEGDFLEGLELPDCLEFQSWCTGEREAARVPLQAELRSRAVDRIVLRTEAERLRASAALHEVQFCTTSDGVRIAYACVGDGPPVVWAAHWLSHLAFSWESPIWRHWTEEFASDHCFVHYDERGNGLSDWDNPTFSVDAFVR